MSANPHPRGWPIVAIAALAILAGIALRVSLDLRSGFWEDELIAVTHAMQPMPFALVDLVRNDIHPPLYFLQLHVWSWGGHSDLWFAANSVFWGLVAIGSLWLVLRREDGPALAWAGAGYLAVLPAGLWMSQEVRPYAWLSVLLIWAYGFAVRGFAVPGAGPRTLLGLALFCLGIIYSHAIGFFAVLLLGVFSLLLLAQRRAPRGEWVRCVVLYALLGAASVPVLALNLMHDANLPPIALADSVHWPSDMITAGELHGWPFAGGLLAYAGIAASGLMVRRTRPLAASFLVLPLVLAVAMTVAVKPVFKVNFFATLILPFAAIVLAQVTFALPARPRPYVAAAALAALLVLSVAAWRDRTVSRDFRPAAADIAADSRPGDAIYAPQFYVFEGIAWYLAGPDWGSPLTVADRPNPAWQHVYDRLGPGLVRRLHLMPATQTVTLPGDRVLLVGRSALAKAARAKRVWLVTYPRVDLPAGWPPPAIGTLKKVAEQRYASLVVTLYD